MMPEQMAAFTNSLGDDRNRWRDRAEKAEQRVARLEAALRAIMRRARAELQNDTPVSTWDRPQVFRQVVRLAEVALDAPLDQQPQPASSPLPRRQPQEG